MRVVNKLARRHDRVLTGRGAAWWAVLATVVSYALLTLIFLTAGASARSRAAAITVRLVERDSVVQAGSVAALSAQCPASAPHAVGGEFGSLTSSPPGQLALSGSYPVGAHRWTVLVKNLSSQTLGYYAGVTCIGARGAHFAAPRTSVVIGPQQDGGATVGCPRSARFPLNSTFALQPGSAPGAAAADLTIYGATSNGRPDGTQISGMRNLTDAPVGVFVGATCTSLPTRSPEFQSVVRPGASDGFSSSCPRRGELAVGGEFVAAKSADSSALVLTDYGAYGHSKWIVGARNLSSRVIPYFAGPVCIG